MSNVPTKIKTLTYMERLHLKLRIARHDVAMRNILANYDSPYPESLAEKWSRNHGVPLMPNPSPPPPRRAGRPDTTASSVLFCQISSDSIKSSINRITRIPGISFRK